MCGCQTRDAAQAAGMMDPPMNLGPPTATMRCTRPRQRDNNGGGLVNGSELATEGSIIDGSELATKGGTLA
jgi:hypothetical protein